MDKVKSNLSNKIYMNVEVDVLDRLKKRKSYRYVKLFLRRKVKKIE